MEIKLILTINTKEEREDKNVLEIDNTFMKL